MACLAGAPAVVVRLWDASRTACRFSRFRFYSALLGPSWSRFCIADGDVTYQCRFLRSQTWRRNASAKRIVVTEFGTRAAPDPCQTIFKRFASLKKSVELRAQPPVNGCIGEYPQ